MLLDAPTGGIIRPEGVHISDFGFIYYHKYKTATRSNIVGSPPYLAPEVLIHGKSSITPRSDIWAAGCIGFELCTGEILNDADGVHPVEAYLDNLRTERFRALSGIPSKFGNFVRSIIKRCLEFEVSNRPTATEIRDYIVSGIEGKTVETWRILRLDGPTTTLPIDIDTLSQLAQKENGNADDEWLSVSHADAVPSMTNHEGSISAEGRMSIDPTPAVDELTREFESRVSLEDKQLEEDDVSWTTGEDRSVFHKRLIDRGGSGEVHEVLAISPYMGQIVLICNSSTTTVPLKYVKIIT